jgi:hypothetical protein
MSYLGLLERLEKSHSVDGVAHAFSEGVWMPAAVFTPINGGAAATYAEDQAGVDCLILTGSGAQTAILEAPIPFSGRLSGGHGVVIADVTIYYAILTLAITSLTVLAKKIGWAAPNAVAAAPTVTTLAVTTTPASATLTVSAGNAFYALKCALAAANASTADAEAIRLSISPVLASTSVFKFAGAQVHYAIQ